MWARFFLPSITDLVFILLLISLTYGVLAPRLLGDSDIGWHIRDGQNIVETHAIPHVDPFSSTMAGRPWYAWEWLYDAAIGLIYNRAGLNGVVFASALIIASTLAFVFRFSILRGGSVPVTVVLFVLCAMSSSIHFLARPHVVGWLITVVWFWILDTATLSGQSRRLFWLPPLMVLWTNVHAGFVTGLILVGMFFAAEVLNSFTPSLATRQRGRKNSVTLAGVLVLSALASLVNPYGFQLHRHVYGYLTNRFFMQHIDEFRRPIFSGLPEQAFVLLLAMTLVAVVVNRKALRWSDLLVVMFSAFTGLYAARNLPIASMFLVMIAAPLLSREASASHKESAISRVAARMRAFGARATGSELRFRTHLWPIMAVLVSTWICSQHGSFLGKQVMNARFDPEKLPVKAADVMAARGIREPVFTTDSWGGYLIYRLYPDEKVVVDDRHDLYGEAYLREYLKVLHVTPGWQQVLDNQNVNLILLPAKSKLGDSLRSTESWRNVYEDKTSVMFERESKEGR